MLLIMPICAKKRKHKDSSDFETESKKSKHAKEGKHTIHRTHKQDPSSDENDFGVLRDNSHESTTEPGGGAELVIKPEDETEPVALPEEIDSVTEVVTVEDATEPEEEVTEAESEVSATTECTTESVGEVGDIFDDTDDEKVDWGHEDDYWDFSHEESAEKTYSMSLRGKLRRQMAVSLLILRLPNSTVCSPISALMPLGKLALGASGNTLKELLAAVGTKTVLDLKLHMSSTIKKLKSASGVNISMGSALFVDKNEKVNAKFKANAEKVFGTAVEHIDFKDPDAAADNINSWVSEHTKNKIKNLFQPGELSSTTPVVLVNAIYFSGHWKMKFKKQTGQSTFYGFSGNQQVRMMENIGEYRYYNSFFLDSELVEIPYKSDSRVSFLIVLPKQKVASVLLLVLKATRDLFLDEMRKMEPKKLKLTMPSFKVESKFDLGKQYKNIGVKSVFSSGNLNGILENSELKVSKAVQSAIIEVDEEGTTAAAASAAVTTFLSGRPDKNVMHVNVNRHFFYILLLDDEQLFSGFVGDVSDDDSYSDCHRL